ncbi:hypothetical protein BKA82DRAFT_995780 [Pisolithus tinctorius]|uniref:Protein kinase domain-containing protein n=1 Tax=Pisolithus tinctorius Marx 270 TaxID=870435 RepID=A0A0C3KLU5_PISTI|nr:hypothetical protein BKA82DRAFT_995780 [Pisolithus tinctorius]KIO10587.1 hypothetical protein M404DRAFT_995780 [Pisolithus tinctorius Marx 270]
MKQLASPITNWRRRTPRNFRNALGPIDDKFFETKTYMLPPSLEISSIRLYEHLQVIVLLTKQPQVRHVDILDAWTTNRRKTDFPPVEQLRELVEMPLAESEKIPVSDRMYAALTSERGSDFCSEDHVGELFKVAEFDPRFSALYFAVDQSAPNCGPEFSFIPFWDNNICNVIALLVPGGRAIRHSPTDISNFPKFGFLVNHVCLFRGEERAPHGKDDPRVELIKKFQWTYGSVPYMFGYYCRGTEMTLTAIIAPRAPENKIRLHDIITVDLKYTRDRIANIRHLINLSSVLLLLGNLVSSPVDDFTVLPGTESTVMFNPTEVVKIYQRKDAEEKVNHLEKIYGILKDKSIPNTDMLVRAQTDAVVLVPRGTPQEPGTENELRECLVCVLDALVALHHIPLYHRDIRWSNVIRTIDDRSKWILIGWDDAAVPPTQALSFAREREHHSPAIFRDGHGEEVDIWAVGRLIRTCTAADVSVQMRRLGALICEESAKLHAKDVIALLNNTSKLD